LLAGGKAHTASWPSALATPCMLQDLVAVAGSPGDRGRGIRGDGGAFVGRGYDPRVTADVVVPLPRASGGLDARRLSVLGLCLSSSSLCRISADPKLDARGRLTLGPAPVLSEEPQLTSHRSRQRTSHRRIMSRRARRRKPRDPRCWALLSSAYELIW
jgi:hypothetical protein